MVIDISRARKSIEKLYFEICTISCYEEREDSNGISRNSWVETVKGQPCKRSIKTIKQAEISADVAETAKLIKLFLAPEINVPAGSRIEVKGKHGTERYKSSGTPAIFQNHQEIILEVAERWT